MLLECSYAIGAGVGLQHAVHFKQRRRRLLQVCVHQTHRVPLGMLKACEQSAFLAEVAGKIDHDGALGRCGSGQLVQQARRAVGAAVVHQNQLVRHSRGGKSIVNRAKQQRQRPFFVVAWHDNGKIHRKPPFRLITASDCTPSSKADPACCRNATSWENRDRSQIPTYDIAIDTAPRVRASSQTKLCLQSGNLGPVPIFSPARFQFHKHVVQGAVLGGMDSAT